MKKFCRITFDASLAKADLDQFSELLADSREFQERELLTFFRNRIQLIALMGTVTPHILRPDRYAYKFDIFGSHVADFVIGDGRSRAYAFIEFENAESNSVFKKKPTKSTSIWSSRFEQG